MNEKRIGLFNNPVFILATRTSIPVPAVFQPYINFKGANMEASDNFSIFWHIWV